MIEAFSVLLGQWVPRSARRKRAGLPGGFALAVVLVATGAYLTRPAVALDLHRAGAQEAEHGAIAELDRSTMSDPDPGIDVYPTLAPEAFSLQGESIPANLRLSIFVQYMAVSAKEKPDSAQFRLAHFGLHLDQGEIQELARLYGDFDGEQRRRLAREAAGHSAGSAMLGHEMTLERDEFVGRIFGEWLDFLRSRGHEVESLVSSILSYPGLGMAMSFGGSIPTYEELEERSRRFGTAFEEQFGPSLRAVVPVD